MTRLQRKPLHRSADDSFRALDSAKPSPLGAAIRAALITTTLTPCALPFHALADESAVLINPSRSYSIPAGPLGEALNQFARQAGIMLSATPEQTSGALSPGLQGSYSTDHALTILLGGSGLQAVSQDGSSYVLRKADGEAMSLPSTDVRGFALGNALGSMEGYNATHSQIATKTSTPLLETSQSVSVVTREQMDDQGSQTVAQAMRYKDFRRAFLHEDRHEATGKCDHVTRNIAIRNANRQSVTRAVRKPRKGEMTTIDPVTRRDFLECLLQALEVRTAAANHDVPRCKHGMRCEDQEFVALGMLFDERQHLLREAARSMEHDEQRDFLKRVEPGWHEQYGIALAGYLKPVAARRQRVFAGLGRRERETAEQRRIEHYET